MITVSMSKVDCTATDRREDVSAEERGYLDDLYSCARTMTGRIEAQPRRPETDRYRVAPCNNCGMEPDVADLTLPEEDRQELIRWTVACVERLLPVFEADRPEDPRLSDALDGARQFAAGRLSVGPMRKLAFGCHAAAREASTAPATAVARACGQAVAVAHMAGHSREIVRYTSKALTGKTLAQELEWQRTHVPARFRDYVYGDAA